MIIDKELIPHINKALKIELTPLQIKFLTTNDKNMGNHRQIGKTTCYIILLCLCNENILMEDLKKGLSNDEFHDYNYTLWFSGEYLKIREKLKIYGFKVSKILNNNRGIYYE